ncbi:hypothetical protein K435DRAFT_288347 [Dendrothele bispora CBS 962.96]|uniref:Uncharacterized protein n=1 Tax=Dendrothele bispora (strain CBS 962.96) TaxID=1314807 RepID=A0A4S8LJT4_DENBC|nr:hypothetical protein K435DRAFT_288347 [Dendrothele bispora CBS 962.96]
MILAAILSSRSRVLVLYFFVLCLWGVVGTDAAPIKWTRRQYEAINNVKRTGDDSTGTGTSTSSSSTSSSTVIPISGPMNTPTLNSLIGNVLNTSEDNIAKIMNG